MTEFRETSGEIIRAESVCKTYDDGQVKALVDVSVTVCRREYVAITGPSGCGKSTLLNMLGGLDSPTLGKVYFCGTALDQLASLDDYRRNRLGFVFQSFHLMPTLRALENVQIPMFRGKLSIRQRIEKSESLLELVGLKERRFHLPNQLSVGERQRVAIARALANDPELLLGDEPTGNLDSKNSAGILDLVDRLLEENGITFILVTHSDALTQRAHRVLRLEDGQIVGDSS